MSIDKFYITKNKYTPMCDICGKTLPAVNTFNDAVDAIKAAGWKSNVLRVDGHADIVQDLCCECRNEGEDDE